METDVQPAKTESRILTMRNRQAMPDRDLAGLHGAETKRITGQENP